MINNSCINNTYDLKSNIFPKKNLGICLSGNLRNIKLCYINFIKNIILPNQTDYNIYLFYYLPKDTDSKWKEIYNIKEIMELNPIIKIGEDDKNIKLPEIKGFHDSTIVKPADNISTTGIKGLMYQAEGIYKSYNLLLDYEKEKNIKFDYISRCRHDVIFIEPTKFINLNLNNYIFLPNFSEWGGINDRFAIGNKAMMHTYMNLFNNLYSKTYVFNDYKYINRINPSARNAELFFQINLDANNIEYKKFNIKFIRVKLNGEITYADLDH